MTKFAKILAVFTTFASLAFLGAAAVTLLGGPNWQTEAEAEDLKPFVFSQSDGETPTWSVKTRRGEETVSSNKPMLAAAVIDARKRLRQTQQEQINELDKQIGPVEQRLQQAIALIEADIKAMQAHESQLVVELEKRHTKVAALAKQGVEIAQQTRETRQQAGERRADVFRLQNQVEEIRTDRYRAESQVQKLRDSLVRLRGYLDRAERRQQQLMTSASGDKSDSESEYEKEVTN